MDTITELLVADPHESPDEQAHQKTNDQPNEHPRQHRRDHAAHPCEANLTIEIEGDRRGGQYINRSSAYSLRTQLRIRDVAQQTVQGVFRAARVIQVAVA